MNLDEKLFGDVDVMLRRAQKRAQEREEHRYLLAMLDKNLEKEKKAETKDKKPNTRNQRQETKDKKPMQSKNIYIYTHFSLKACL